MVPWRSEEITLPLRFICKTIHFVAVLTVLFDAGVLISQMYMIDPETSTVKSDIDLYNSKKSTLEGLCYGAIACFGIEYITLFLGVSMFFPGVMCLNILLHFVGMILTILFYNDNWSFDSFIAFFVVFNAVPAMIELLTFLFLTRFSFLKY